MSSNHLVVCWGVKRVKPFSRLAHSVSSLELSGRVLVEAGAFGLSVFFVLFGKEKSRQGGMDGWEEAPVNLLHSRIALSAQQRQHYRVLYYRKSRLIAL